MRLRLSVRFGIMECGGLPRSCSVTQVAAATRGPPRPPVINTRQAHKRPWRETLACPTREGQGDVERHAGVAFFQAFFLSTKTNSIKEILPTPFFTAVINTDRGETFTSKSLATRSDISAPASPRNSGLSKYFSSHTYGRFVPTRSSGRF